jgi:drug/metabolite transporter (DMT)-like permease
VVAGFLLSINLIDMSELRARTVATTVLVAVGLYLIVVLEASSRVRGYTVGALCAVLFALYLVVLSLPGWRDFFEVAAPDPAIILVSLAGTALAVTGLVLTDERFVPRLDRRPSAPPEPPSGPAPA